MHETNQKPILISHASDDKALVEKFVDLLVDGIGVRRDDIFCTSLEQMGVPPGENFVSFIKSQIQSPQLVLMVITPTYLRRTFCLCEMGACWALSLKGIPLIAEPVSFSDLGGVVSEVQVTKLSDKSRMTELRDSVVQEMNLEGKFSTVWERKRDEFIDWLDSNPAVSPKSTSIAEVASAPMEMTDSPSMKLAGRIGKVIQLIERRLGNGDAQISSDATRRLFKDVHELLTNIYAEAPDGLRSATFRECVTLVEDVYAPHPFEKAYKTVERVTKAVDRLREFHEYLMVGI